MSSAGPDHFRNWVKNLQFALVAVGSLLNWFKQRNVMVLDFLKDHSASYAGN